MKVVRYKLLSLMLVLILFCSIFTGCGKSEANVWLADSIAPTSSTKGNDGDMYLNTSNYDLYQMKNSKWIKIGNIKGEKGDKGDKGDTPTIEISEDGYWVINGKKTTTRAQGRDGKDGVSPLISISEDGYWVINSKKTGVLAKAQDGKNGSNGKDGIAPTIEFSEDGYWIINGVKTKIKAKGEDGKTPTVEISEDGYWVINGVKTKIKAMCKNCIQQSAAEIYLIAVNNLVEKENPKPTECTIVANGNLDCDTKKEILEVEVDGETPNSGKILFKDGKIVDIILDYETATIVKNEEGNLIAGWAQDKTKVKKRSFGEEEIVLEVGTQINTTDAFETTIYPSWVVLGAKNGKLLLTIKYWKAVKLLGRENYYTGIDYLDELSQSIVVKNDIVDKVRSINVEDLNRVTGYNPMKTGTGLPYKNGERGMYGETVTYYMKDGFVASTNELGETTGEYTSFEHVDGRILVNSQNIDTANKKFDKIEVKCNNYSYFPTTLTTSKDGNTVGLSSTSKAHAFLFSGTKYWLASTLVHTGKSGASWGMRFVDSTTNITGASFKNSADSSDIGTTAIVLPVVELDLNVQVIKDDEGNLKLKNN